MDNLENSLPRGFAIPFYKSEKGNERPRSKEEPPQNRVPFLDWMPDSWRNHLIAMMGEFVGTFLFLFFAFSGTQVAFNGEPNSSNNSSKVPNPLILFYVSVSFGFSLLVNVWVFFRISGGMFNPAVTLGMALIGAVPYWRSLWVFIAQIIGGIASAGVVSCLFPGPLAVQTTLGGSTSVVQGLFIEMFLTAELVFTIFMLAAEKHKSTFLAPMGIGLSLFIAELSGVYFTGGSLNPTRSFGPAVIDRNFPGYHWIYWVGPILGALLASGFYKFCKMVEYETANPGQDLDDKEAQVFNPDESIERPSVSAAEPDYVTDGHGKVSPSRSSIENGRRDRSRSQRSSAKGSRPNSQHGTHTSHSGYPTGRSQGGYSAGRGQGYPDGRGQAYPDGRVQGYPEGQGYSEGQFQAYPDGQGSSYPDGRGRRY